MSRHRLVISSHGSRVIGTSSQLDHLADRLPVMKPIEALVDVFEVERSGQQPVHREQAPPVQLDIAGNVSVWYRRADVAALEGALLGHQGDRGQWHGCGWWGKARCPSGT